MIASQCVASLIAGMQGIPYLHGVSGVLPLHLSNRVSVFKALWGGAVYDDDAQKHNGIIPTPHVSL